MTSCKVPSCERKKHARGYCNAHYKRMKRSGRTEKLSRIQRFESHLVREDENGCWIWDKPRRDGYGQFFGAAHRWSYEYHIGPIPDGLHIDHLCRNRACVNPWHLEPVPLIENVMRGHGFYAQNARKTHCIRGHEFSPENTYVTPNGRRQCRKCLAMHQSRNRSQKAALAA